MAKTGEGESLGTAEGAVLGRATHTLHDEKPVLNDTWAIELLGPTTQVEARDAEHQRRLREDSAIDFRLILAVGIGSLRYAEDEVDRCAADGIHQYVVLGAGFDTFALRRGDVADRLRVYEVDFPDVQALKRKRIEKAKPQPGQIPTFIPVDFETMSISQGLAATDFDPARPAVWSWMNTIPYLTNEATETTLTEVARLMAPGSRIVLNYQGKVALSQAQIDYLQSLGELVREGGEPMKSLWTPEDFESMLTRCGLRTIDHSTESDLNERYFEGRKDGLYAAMPARLITAGPT
ncbi:MAG: class I SAM-dependent methyltransferase [bacterium]|nr:class I SAM-dependent methyltransferase [bacterium]